jgi:hypothetical protein
MIELCLVAVLRKRFLENGAPRQFRYRIAGQLTQLPVHAQDPAVPVDLGYANADRLIVGDGREIGNAENPFGSVVDVHGLLSWKTLLEAKCGEEAPTRPAK